jgi:hypothetical protein
MPTVTPTPVTTSSAATIPFFQSAFSFGGKTYTYKMVGSNPMTDPVSTTISVQIVPVKLLFSDGVMLDATEAAPTLGATALFTNGQYAEGNGQYGDAFMRSQFWKYASGTNYHVLLANPVVEPTAIVPVPSADGYTQVNSKGILKGFVTYAWFTQMIEPQIIMQDGISPKTLTIFATSNTSLLEPGGHCCFSGYHSALHMMTASGPSIATTAWASVVAYGVEALSHEIGEWLADPFYTNIVPSWINPISSACNGDLLEVGDPVTIYTFSANNTELQDLAFYSWFSRDKPSIGINGKYDLLGRFTSPARSCQ